MYNIILSETHFSKALLLKQKTTEAILPFPTFLYNSVLFKCSKQAVNSACF